MAIDKIQSSGIVENIELSGTEAAKMPTGNTGERANAAAGDIRFNTTTTLMEYYDGTAWKGIDGPPNIQSISPTNIADTDTSEAIVITGTNFSTSPVVKAIGQNSSEITPSSVVRNSASQLTATFNGTQFSDAQEDYGISVTNSSGLAFTLSGALSVNASPAWTVASGSLGTIYNIGRSGISITTGASDDEGASLTYSVSTGSLPSGLSIASSTGTITGTAAAVGSDTTTNFTLSVTDGTNAVTRAYSIIVKAPVITSYTSTGSGTFSVPSGTTAVDVMLVGAGGSGGSDNGGGGAGGGLIFRPAFPVTPGGSVSYTVGAHGQDTPGPVHNSRRGDNGGNSVFGTLTALGGGGGGCGSPLNPLGQGAAGGSGGGAAGEAVHGGGSGQQPGRPGDSGTYGFGTNGGQSPTGQGGAGGGGAGAAGSNSTAASGSGGNGKAYSISGSSVTYAGGGGGGAQNGVSGARSSGGSGGGGQGGGSDSDPVTPGIGGTINRGGGGGGAGNTGPLIGTGAVGGTGIVIVSY